MTGSPSPPPGRPSPRFRGIVATLDPLLAALDRRGFRVTTGSELLGSGPVVEAEPRVWFWQAGFGCPR